MKRIIICSALAIIALVVVALPAQACCGRRGKPAGDQGSGTFMRQGIRGLEDCRFLAELGLTEEQKNVVKALADSVRQAFRSGDSDQIRAAMESFRNGVRALLTDEQKTKMRGWFGQHKGDFGQWRERGRGAKPVH